MALLLSIASISAFVVLFYLLDRQLRAPRAPIYEGLYLGERLIDSCAAALRIDGIGYPLAGFAYLTDMRLIWIPRSGFWKPIALPEALQGIDVPFGQVRKAEVKTWFWLSSPSALASKSLRLSTPDGEIELWPAPRTLFAGRSDPWFKHVVENSPNYGKDYVKGAGLPDVLRLELRRKAKTATLLMAVLLLARLSKFIIPALLAFASRTVTLDGTSALLIVLAAGCLAGAVLLHVTRPRGDTTA